MHEPGANEELFSLIIVSANSIIYILITMSDLGFNDGLGRQDAERVCCIVH